MIKYKNKSECNLTTEFAKYISEALIKLINLNKLNIYLR